MRRSVVVAAGVVVVAALVAVLLIRLGESDGSTTDGPVITLGDDWNAYPAAEVTGRLTLTKGCLLVGRSVVLWPRHTSWDEDQQQVEFGGDFDDAPAAAVGATFTGGGGFYPTDALEGLDGVDADALLECVRTTNADDVVMAYPGD